MNDAINELVRSIVKKNSLAECSVSELQRLTTQYPYFGPVQFLLARKLKEENSSQYEKQSQKAILYFQDDLWFDYVTNSRLNEIVFSKNTEKAEVLPVQPLMSTNESTALVDTEEAIGDKKQVAEKLTEPFIGSANEPGEQIEEIKSETTIEHEIEPIQPTEPIEQTEEQPVEISQQLRENAAPAVTEVREDIIEPDETVEKVEETAEPVQPVIHEKAPVEYDDGSSFSTQSEIKVVEEVHEQPVEPMGSEDLNTEEEVVEEEITSSNTDLPPIPALKIEPFNPETAKLSFEPYHTVDYFASQGIKFKEEEKPKDRFGQQLKSFTEWLKTLKKAPETGAVSSPTANGPEDKKVSQMAAHSLAEGEVVTEAMADVWEKQGNHEKAIETYRKLSLLNPSKSAYFAAKIDHLKQL